jgi:hypothetical protein
MTRAYLPSMWNCLPASETIFVVVADTQAIPIGR